MPDEPQPNETPQPLHAREAGRKFRQASFLSAYQTFGRVNKAAEAAGVDRWTHYEWMKTDPEYVDDFRRAHELAIQAAEDELYRRAVEGVETPKTIAGQAVTVREFSDQLLMFYLKSHKRETYGDRHTLENPPGEVFSVQMVDKILQAP